MSLRMCYKKPMNLYYVADKISPKQYSQFGYLRDLIGEFTARYMDKEDFNIMIFSPSSSSKRLQKEFAIGKHRIARSRTPKIISSMMHQYLKTPLRIFDKGSIVHCFDNPAIRTSKPVKKIFEPISAKKYIIPNIFNKQVELFSSIKDIAKCDVVVAHTQHIAEELSSKLFIESDRIRIIPRAVEPKIDKDHKSTLKLPNKYFLFLGRIEKYKNIERFVKAFSFWAPKDTYIVFAGDSQNRSFSNKIRKFSSQLLGDKVIFTGYLKKQDLWLAIKEATAVFDPSYVNDFPETILEAQAIGTPTIVSDIISHKETCKDTTLYFNPLCEKSMMSAMDGVIDKKVQEALIKKGKNNSLSFTWDEVIPLYKDLYNSI